MTARVLAAAHTARRFAKAVPALSFPTLLGALGLLLVAKSGLVIDRIVFEGGSGAAGATVPPPRAERPPPFFLEPGAGPAPANEPVTASAESNEPVAGRDGVGSGPPRFSATELELLGMLDERRAALDEREQKLDLRAAMLETAKAQLAEQLEELRALQASIEARIEKHDAAEKAKLARLVKIYERMKPKAAAAIFDRLEMGVLLDVVARMAETKASAVIARMDPARARQLTTELAAREELAHLDH